jgi:hypothetical protein
LRRDVDPSCAYCGRFVFRGSGDELDAECDHVVPVAQGGTDTSDNIAIACRRCNRAKRARTVRQWLGIIAAPPWAVAGWIANRVPGAIDARTGEVLVPVVDALAGLPSSALKEDDE